MNSVTKAYGKIPVEKLSEPTEETLAKIGEFSRRPMKAEEVYVFPVVLCDNEIDRDGERFSTEALHSLAKLFIGKTGVFDHSMKGSDQTARIFETCVERNLERKTKIGEDYTCLRAMAYMVRTERNESLVKEIDAGIKKEVSVGCAVGKTSCSVCGKPFGSCNHERGKLYGGVICHCVLEEPTDAYEWSFVAVPAQPGAGVTKSFSANANDSLSTAEIVKKCRYAVEDVTLSRVQAKKLAEKIDLLESLAEEGKAYRDSLKSKVKGLWLSRLPGSEEKMVNSVCEKMEIKDLVNLQKAFSEVETPQVQLYSSAPRDKTDDDVFKI